MPNFSGNWKIIRSENFEDLLKVLGKEIFERPGEERGLRSPRRWVGERKGSWNQGLDDWAPASPQKGPDAWVLGRWPGGLNPAFSGGAPTHASSCSDSGRESTRN